LPRCSTTRSLQMRVSKLPQCLLRFDTGNLQEPLPCPCHYNPHAALLATATAPAQAARPGLHRCCLARAACTASSMGAGGAGFIRSTCAKSKSAVGSSHKYCAIRTCPSPAAHFRPAQFATGSTPRPHRHRTTSNSPSRTAARRPTLQSTDNFGYEIPNRLP
jgi:hypothetical protein